MGSFDLQLWTRIGVMHRGTTRERWRLAGAPRSFMRELVLVSSCARNQRGQTRQQRGLRKGGQHFHWQLSLAGNSALSQVLNLIRQQIRFAMHDLDGTVFITETIQDLRDVAGRWADVNDRRAHGQDVVNLARMHEVPAWSSPITTTCASAADSDAASSLNG